MAGWVAGGGGIGNKAQLRPAKLELGLGLSLAIEIEQDLGRKCSAWIDFGLETKISPPPSLRDIGLSVGGASGQLLSFYEAYMSNINLVPSLEALDKFVVGG